MISVGYILSSGHSGSTLLDLLLGGNDEIEGLGEVQSLVRHLGKTKGGTCTCGRSVRECNVWKRVLERIEHDGLRLLDNVPSSPRFLDFINALHESVYDSTQKKIHIDSSKRSGRFNFARKSNVLDARLVYLVRDGRAVAYSNKKKGRDYLGFADNWKKKNTSLLQLYKSLPKENAFLVRYEDLAANAPLVLDELYRFLGCQKSNLSLQWSDRIKHNIGGNRMRYSDDSKIKIDDEYLDEVSNSEWDSATVGAQTLLQEFRYPLSRDEMRDFLSHTL